MFVTRHLSMHLASAALQLEMVGQDERAPVAVVGLTLEPLTQALAKEISEDVAAHCYTKGGKLRPEVRRLVIRNPEGAFALEARMAEDVQPSATLRNVRIQTVTISKRGEAKDEKGAKGKKKSKKVKPAAEVLRAQLRLLVGVEHRDFFCINFGATLLYTFASEQPTLLDAPPVEPKVPGTDTGAGDILEEQADLQHLGKKKPGPRLVKKAKGGDAAEAPAQPADPS